MTNPAAAAVPLPAMLRGAHHQWKGFVVIGMLFLACAGWFVLNGRFVHDEGLLTWLYASYLSKAPLPVIFWMKAKPILALLNLPGTLLGPNGFYAGHLCIGTAGLLWTWGAARASGIRSSLIPGLVLATSPLYLTGTSSGISNVDGAAALAFVLWLTFTNRPRLALLVAGAMPLIRFELCLPVLLILALCLRRHRLGVSVLWVTVPGVVYATGGMIYHANVLWFVDFPPAWINFAGKNASVEAQASALQVMDVVIAFVLTSPALLLLLLLGIPRLRSALTRDDLYIAVTLIAGIAALTALPFLKAFAGFSQRYYLFLLPLAALLYGRTVDAFETRLETLVVAALPLFLGTTTLLVPIPGIRNELETSESYRGVPEAVEFIASRPELEGVPIRTNSTVLAALLERNGASNDVQTLVAPDMLMEIHGWSNPKNGQQQRLDELIRWRFYGRGISIDDFRNAPSGTIYLLTDDARLDEVLPRGAIMAQSDLLYQSGDITITRLRSGVSFVKAMEDR